MRLKINVTGIVQGVGFRPFIYRIATANGLSGYVRNMGDAGVEIIVEGANANLKTFLHSLKNEVPPQARLSQVFTKTLLGDNRYTSFQIILSSHTAEISGSIIPPDIAICNDCLRELRDPNNPRFKYFFITCTNCGPRFTIIDKLPYDRENTTMKDFPLCSFCQKEYKDPLNRRFHAQTIACPPCGPKVYLTTSNGTLIENVDPVNEASKLLSEGATIAVKGYGGFHIACSTVKEQPLMALRRAKHRKNKPFAIMAKSLETAKTFVEVNSKEQQLLTSPARPIVLLNKSKTYSLSDMVAPDLHNVGVMLPYTGLHYMLFDRVADLAFVMTSANPPNQPIIKDNDEALKTLGGTVDYFLFHNRRIAYRCDDSVTRVHGDRNSFIRRSRGYAPAPIMLKSKAKRCAVGLGGELNNTACILHEDKAFISQHIGDVENLETSQFLRSATEHLKRLTSTTVEVVACDLHPKFTTTALAKTLAEENGWQFLQVQHHHAHVAGLMAEQGVDEAIGVACDGYGYGTDGGAWGGEILQCTSNSTEFKRLAYLEPQPLIGGDTATKYPLRLAAAILAKNQRMEPWLMEKSIYLPHGQPEAQLILQQLEKNNGLPVTTSLGRVLDAAAAVLGICYERTYEGEAAMKLESAAVGGRNVLHLAPIIRGNMLKTTELLVQVFENRENMKKTDLAFSIHHYLAQGLAELAVEAAENSGVRYVGFTGGSAVNGLLAAELRRRVEAAGLRFLVHEAVPAGDGGVGFGQAVVAGFSGF